MHPLSNGMRTLKKKHLMEEMFCAPNRPFYQSTQLMNLEPLQEETYYDFAKKFFEAKKGSFSQQVFHNIYQRFDGYTWYLQAILNRLYEQGKKVETDKQAVEAILFHVNALAPHYQVLVSFLTDNQFSLPKPLPMRMSLNSHWAKSLSNALSCPAPVASSRHWRYWLIKT
jgi:hypothetical protein